MRTIFKINDEFRLQLYKLGDDCQFYSKRREEIFLIRNIREAVNVYRDCCVSKIDAVDMKELEKYKDNNVIIKYILDVDKEVGLLSYDKKEEIYERLRNLIIKQK